jgi:sugar transferase (PEP-CTERM/EpsH1 system associated)
MRHILFLAHRVPDRPDRGDKIRAFHVLKYLATRAHVHVVAFADTAYVNSAPPTTSLSVHPRRKSMLRAGGEALVSGRPVSLTAFDDASMRAQVAATLAKHPIQAIYVFSSQMAQYLPASTSARLVMDFVDVDSAKFAAYAEDGWGPKRWVHAREARLLLAHDDAVAARVDASVFVSEAEAALFRRSTGAERVHAIENGIDTDIFNPDADFARISEQGPLVVFTGQMDYRPNIEAVRWLAEAIRPRLLARVPAARIAIVGRAPTAEVLGRAGPNVIVTGEVADVRGWLAVADVVVAPLKLARGVQNKVLEAMAMARPVVASGAAAEGIDHGGTIRVGKDAAAIAREIAMLIADPAAAAALGASARARVVERYGWDARLASLDSLLGLANAPAPGA